MVGTFYVGHDLLYHHAKFWEIEQRTAAAGLKIWCFYVCCLPAGYREAAECRYQKYLLAGQKSGFLPLMGESLHKFTSNLTPKKKKARKTKFFISIPDPIQPNLAGKGVENSIPFEAKFS